jgi:hypothetical protein
MLKKFADLGHVYRTEPCQEYPGIWWLIVSDEISIESGYGHEVHTSHDSAVAGGNRLIAKLEEMGYEYNPSGISVSWQASEDDPRIGEVWFTGYYQAGYWNQFGSYRTT